ncbi:MAG: sulfotransferase family 2 domain-containing protein [Roseovarius sp.]
MILSPGRNYIFVHIPKTGGTALSVALEGRARKDDILIGDTPKARQRRGRLKGAQAAGRIWKHSSLADIDGLVSRDFIDGAFRFALVRNPWDRVVSYYHWLRDQSFDHPAVHLARRVAFADFVQDEVTQEALRGLPYGSYLRGWDGEEREAHFIRLEHFAQDAAPLWAHLGFALELPHLNASRREAGYRHYYTHATARVVESVCAEDIARFGYSF